MVHASSFFSMGGTGKDITASIAFIVRCKTKLAL